MIVFYRAVLFLLTSSNEAALADPGVPYAEDLEEVVVIVRHGAHGWDSLLSNLAG